MSTYPWLTVKICLVAGIQANLSDIIYSVPSHFLFLTCGTTSKTSSEDLAIVANANFSDTQSLHNSKQMQQNCNCQMNNWHIVEYTCSNILCSLYYSINARASFHMKSYFKLQEHLASITHNSHTKRIALVALSNIVKITELWQQ